MLAADGEAGEDDVDELGADDFDELDEEPDGWDRFGESSLLQEPVKPVASAFSAVSSWASSAQGMLSAGAGLLYPSPSPRDS